MLLGVKTIAGLVGVPVYEHFAHRSLGFQERFIEIQFILFALIGLVFVIIERTSATRVATKTIEVEMIREPNGATAAEALTTTRRGAIYGPTSLHTAARRPRNGKILAFLYGIVVYLIFFTFVYVIGFVATFWFPSPLIPAVETLLACCRLTLFCWGFSLLSTAQWRAGRFRIVDDVVSPRH